MPVEGILIEGFGTSRYPRVVRPPMDDAFFMFPEGVTFKNHCLNLEEGYLEMTFRVPLPGGSKNTFQKKEGSMNQTNQSLQAAELLSKRIEQAGEAARKAQEAAREANSALSALEQQRKAVEALRADLASVVQNRCNTLINEEVSRQLGEMGEQTRAAMDASVAKVGKEFERLEKMYLGTDPENGKASIPDLLEQARDALKTEWPRLVEYIVAAKATALGCSALEEDGALCPGVVKWSVKYNAKTADGQIGEGHSHLCVKHKNRMNSDPEVEVLVNFRLETNVCPFPHGDSRRFLLDTEDGYEIR
jgi:hypothetical protein